MAKIRIRNRKSDQKSVKFLTMRQKHNRYKIATVLLLASWIIYGIIVYCQ